MEQLRVMHLTGMFSKHHQLASQQGQHARWRWRHRSVVSCLCRQPLRTVEREVDHLRGTGIWYTATISLQKRAPTTGFPVDWKKWMGCKTLAFPCIEASTCDVLCIYIGLHCWRDQERATLFRWIETPQTSRKWHACSMRDLRMLELIVFMTIAMGSKIWWNQWGCGWASSPSSGNNSKRNYRKNRSELSDVRIFQVITRLSEQVKLIDN